MGILIRHPDETSKLLFEHLSTVAQEYGTELRGGVWVIDETLLNQMDIIVYIDGYRLIMFWYSTDYVDFGSSYGKTEDGHYFNMYPDGYMEVS